MASAMKTIAVITGRLIAKRVNHMISVPSAPFALLYAANQPTVSKNVRAGVFVPPGRCRRFRHFSAVPEAYFGPARPIKWPAGTHSAPTAEALGSPECRLDGWDAELPAEQITVEGPKLRWITSGDLEVHNRLSQVLASY
jgi:hypothetical protein